MPRRNRPKRGRYSRLSADKLKDIYQCLSDDPEIRTQELMRRYHLKRRAAPQLMAQFPTCPSAEEFHHSETRGRRRKNYALLHSKIDDILRSDSGLTLKSVVSRLSRLHGVNVSTETVSRALKRMHWTYRKQHFCPKGRNDPATKALRRVYC
eukprot:EG_transcript_39941